jgi:hypothetical protein
MSEFQNFIKKMLDCVVRPDDPDILEWHGTEKKLDSTIKPG